MASISGMAAKALRPISTPQPGHDDLRSRVFAPRLADRLARLPFCLAGHGAGIEDDRTREARRARMATNNLGLIGVEAAAESDDFARGSESIRLLSRAWPSFTS